MVLVLYSRAVVGWSMGEWIARNLLVMATLTMANVRRRPAPGLILHADRGSPYAALDYQALLEQHGILCSMSQPGDCDDHAAMANFFHTLSRCMELATRPGRPRESMCSNTSRPTQPQAPSFDPQ